MVKPCIWDGFSRRQKWSIICGSCVIPEDWPSHVRPLSPVSRMVPCKPKGSSCSGWLSSHNGHIGLSWIMIQDSTWSCGTDQSPAGINGRLAPDPPGQYHGYESKFWVAICSNGPTKLAASVTANGFHHSTVWWLRIQINSDHGWWSHRIIPKDIPN